MADIHLVQVVFGLGLFVVAQSMLGLSVVGKAARGGGQTLAKLYRVSLILSMLPTVRPDRF